MIERVQFGGRPQRAGRVVVSEGDDVVIGLGVTATDVTELADATAAVWTNVGTPDPGTFRAVPMTPVPPSDGHQRAYEAVLEAPPLGTFMATAYVEVGANRHWGETDGIVGPVDRNLVFRVRPRAVDRLYIRQVPVDKANARAGSTDISTLDDMLGDQQGKYSLAELQRQGVGCVWVQVPYRLDVWSGVAPGDDAGSDYASNDWFAVDPQLSVDARRMPEWDLDRQRELANATMRRFVDEAHDRGLSVIFDIAPHHVGHNYVFRDDFTVPGRTEVRRGDYTQAVVDAAQLAQVQARLADTSLPADIKNYAEYMLPQMYAGRWPDGKTNPFGAASVNETYSPWWYGNWSDTKHLNHGGAAHEGIWIPRTEQNWRVLAYIGRAMEWAVRELGVDGFRVDHTFGMPFAFLELILPRVERRTRPLLLVHEDHNRKRYTAGVGDVTQANAYFGLLEAFARRDAAGVRGYHADPAHGLEFVGSGNHDERRGSTFFGGDLIGYGNALMTMLLWGGPVTTLAGDEYAEAEQLRFKARGGVPTLTQRLFGTLPQANRELESWITRAALLRRDHPAFARAGREDLPVAGGILAAARFGDDPDRAPVLVANLLGGDGWTERICPVGARIGAWLDPAAYYQVRDLLSLDPERPLWRQALPGSELLEKGMSIGLLSRQIQALELGVV